MVGGFYIKIHIKFNRFKLEKPSPERGRGLVRFSNDISLRSPLGKRFRLIYSPGTISMPIFLLGENFIVAVRQERLNMNIYNKCQEEKCNYLPDQGFTNTPLSTRIKFSVFVNKVTFYSSKYIDFTNLLDPPKLEPIFPKY